MSVTNRFVRIILVACMLATSSALVAQQAMPDDKVFQSMGRESGLRQIVDDFLVIVLKDPRIKESFEDADLEQLAASLTDQFCMLTGGPCQYEGDGMKEVHEGLELTNAHFNALAEGLQEAMVQNKVPYGAQYALLAKLAPMQRDIVTR
jgi:hemoglobin